MNKVVGRLSIALVSGFLLGGLFVYASAGSPAARNGDEAAGQLPRADYRSPKEAYYKPFALGFALGAVGGLITGALIYDPFAKRD